MLSTAHTAVGIQLWPVLWLVYLRNKAIGSPCPVPVLGIDDLH